MNADYLSENFEILADASGGIDRLRELLLHLAISGKLLPQISAEVQEEILWSVDSLRLDEHRIWGESFLENSPATWQRIPLARLGSWGSGGTPTRGNKNYYDGEIPWLVIGDLNDGVITRATNSITKEGLEQSSAVIVPVGAVFVAMYGSIGKSGIAGFECATNQAIAHCVPDPKVISTEFLFLIIRAVKPRLFSQGRGLAQQNISQTVLKHLMISVPPLAEQKRIVAKVNELVLLCDQLEQLQRSRDSLRVAARKSAIDAISTATTPEEIGSAWKRINNNWEVIADTPESIESLRALVFELATYGVLVNQDKSDKAQTFAQTEGPFSIPSNWIWTNLGEISKYGGGGSVSPPEIQPTDWVLDLEDIEKGTSRLIERVTANSRPIKSNKARFKVGDVLYGKLRPYLDKVLVAESDGFCTTEIVSITPKDEIDPYWLRISLKSPRFLTYVTSKSYGMKMPRLGTKDAIASIHAVPPLAEQKRIVAKVDELLLLCDLLEAGLMARNELAEKFARSVVNAS